MIKKCIIFFVLLGVLSISACARVEEMPETLAHITENEITYEITNAESSTQKPETQDELFEYVITKWKLGEALDLYEYADTDMKKLITAENFVYLFESVSSISGNLNRASEIQTSQKDGIVTYTSLLVFDNIKTEVSISFNGLQLCSFYHNIYFDNAFEIDHGKYTEKYFAFENDGCKLNAVYTFINDGQQHPAVFLISGSGPSDYNSTVGILKPFEDIAQGFAENGINSLRIDKRTLNYADEFGQEGGIDEEYLSDCQAAIKYLNEQNISNLYLLGHSLGGQIACELVASDPEIDGMILFNSSARHLADIACDQYTLIDPNNKNVYIEYAETAKNALPEYAKGYYYYGASDYYWASYNQIDTLQNIKDSNVKTLIINSRYDSQTFDADIQLWQSAFSNNENITLQVFDDISHFGYKINTADQASLYRRTIFPIEIINEFIEFIQ